MAAAKRDGKSTKKGSKVDELPWERQGLQRSRACFKRRSNRFQLRRAIRFRSYLLTLSSWQVQIDRREQGMTRACAAGKERSVGWDRCCSKGRSFWVVRSAGLNFLGEPEEEEIIANDGTRPLANSFRKLKGIVNSTVEFTYQLVWLGSFFGETSNNLCAIDFFST